MHLPSCASETIFAVSFSSELFFSSNFSCPRGCIAGCAEQLCRRLRSFFSAGFIRPFQRGGGDGCRSRIAAQLLPLLSFVPFRALFRHCGTAPCRAPHCGMTRRRASFLSMWQSFLRKK